MKQILNESTIKQQIEDGLNGMRPGQMMVAISKSLGQSSSKFLGKHLLKIIVNAAKNGKVKASALGGAIKDFGKKNVEDTSNIDWKHVKLDPASMKFKCVFEGDAKKKIDEFMKQYEADMKDVKAEIDEQDKKLRDDAKKAKLGMSDKEVDENGVAVASVIDDKENKGKSGKELRKKVDNAIKKDKEVKKVLDAAKKIKKASAKVKVDPKLKKLSDEELAKKNEEAEKKTIQKSDASKANDKLRTKLKSAIQKSVSKDFKNSVKTMFISTKSLKKTIEKNLKSGLKVDNIEEPRAVCISVQCGKKDFKKILSEASGSGEKVIDITSGSKNNSVQKIINYIKDKVTSVIGKDKVGDFYAYRKNSNSGNVLLYVFAGVKEDALSESILNEEFSFNVDGKAADPKLYISTTKIGQMLKSLGSSDSKMRKLFSKSVTGRNIVPGKLSSMLSGFNVRYADDPDKALKTLMAGAKNAQQADALAELAAKLRPDCAEKLASLGHSVNGTIDIAADAAKNAASNAGKAIAGHVVDDTVSGDNAAASLAVLPDGTNIPKFDFGSMNDEIGKMNEFFADGTIDSSELAQISEMGEKVGSLSQWASENYDSDNSAIKAKVAAIQALTDKYNEIVDSHSSEMESALSQADDARTGATEATRSASKEMANNEEMQKAAGGWKQALGLDKMFTAIGIARLAAKTTGLILNNGKSVVDALGAYAMKNKEDKNVIAQLNFILQNGEDSKSKFDDTKFSVRYDIGDNKWHATCLDNRKMKFPEDEVINKVLNSKEGKKFKKYCLDKWRSIFQPKDERRAIVPYILKNFDKIGIDASKETKDFIGTMKKMSDNFGKIEQNFK